MRIYDSIQANTGLFMSGLGVPEDTLGSIAPPIPGKDLHFDNRSIAVLGVATVVLGAYGAHKHRQETKDRLEIQFPAGRDNTEIAKKPLLNDRRKSLFGLAAITIGLSSLAVDSADPYTEESVNKIENLAVVVDMGYESRAGDVISGEGQVTRYVASVNGLTLDEYAFSSLDGIGVTYIGAGVNPQNMGTILEGTKAEKSEVIANFEEYRDPSQYGTESSGGGDIATALEIADGLDPDKVVIATGTMRGGEQPKILDDEKKPVNHNVSIIALGKNGTEVELLGGTAEAPVDEAYNDKIVGPEDSYTAISMDELEEVIDEIVDKNIIDNERNDIKLFKKIYTYAFVAAGLLYVYQIFNDTRRRNKPNKRKN